jgi:short-subunit dehydrogenase
MENIKGKRILVIGATGGIGSQLVTMLKNSGASLFIAGRQVEKLQKICLANHIQTSHSFVGDLTNLAERDRLHEAYFSQFDSIDVLINLSGIGILKSTADLTEEEFMQTMQINLLTPFGIIKRFLPHMKTQGRGLMIHVPGILGKVPMQNAAAYCASKYGLVGMLQSIREEIKRTSIRFTSIYLGGVDTPFWDNIDMRVQRDKMVTDEEAAKAIWFLCMQPDSGVISEMVLQPFNHQAI